MIDQRQWAFRLLVRYLAAVWRTNSGRGPTTRELLMDLDALMPEMPREEKLHRLSRLKEKT